MEGFNILFRNCENLTVLDISNFITNQISDCTYALQVFFICDKLEYVNLYNAKDNCVISGSDLNEINNLTICQQNVIITNPTAKNDCRGYDSDIDSNISDETLDSKEESQNYIALTFNQECSFEITGDIREDYTFNKSDISYIYFQKENMNKTSSDTLTVSNGSVIEIHFNRILTSCNGFINFINDEILDKIISIDLSNFDLTQVTDMSAMFADCAELESIKFPIVNTSEVTDFSSIFQNCYSLGSIDLSNFKTPKLENMNSAFIDCNKLKYINLSSFDASNVEDMNQLFYNCSSLESIDLSSFQTGKVSRMGHLFGYCYSLKSINLSNFDTTNVGDMSYMFTHCSSLTSIDFRILRPMH